MKSIIKKWGGRIGVLVFIFAVFGSGWYAGAARLLEAEKVSALYNKEASKPEGVDFEGFWKAWNVINAKFVPTKNATSSTEQEKVYGAIAGLTASLNDPYTVFFPPEEKKSFEQEIAGSFEGVGMELGFQDKMLTVVTPIKGTPAYNAGIKSGDKIIKINDIDSTDFSVDKAVKIIRGKGGTKVKITVRREGVANPIDFNLVRATIQIPTIETSKRADGIFVIKLMNFSANSSELFRKALVEFAGSKTDKLVLDLRGNPGGYLDAAVQMASWFLPQGEVILREDFGKGKPEQTHRSLGWNAFGSNLKMAILIDGGSASASEILAGALREHKKATLIGSKSFGKGSVQEVVPITKDTSLKVTIARWLTPNGLSISEGGLTPDIAVTLSTSTPPKAGTDPVLDRAAVFLVLGK